jgi:hypothetical protein
MYVILGGQRHVHVDVALRLSCFYFIYVPITRIQTSIIGSYAHQNICIYIQVKSDEFYLRAVIGSCNFKTGGDANDMVHGWLNYQVRVTLYILVL